ncbi:uncharacterized protein [Eurosta solidaginis]|uniref:uncharacterized protein isoform X2 n=1 Tax=Eurosta solidaginis TaxID=178769 RepID=UPI00353066A5
MSWKVRRFLKQVRDRKEEEEFKTESTKKKVTVDDTLKSTYNDQSNISTAADTHSKTKTNNVVCTSAGHNEIVKGSSFVSTLSPSFQIRSSPLNINGKYVYWTSMHTELALQPWCCVGDLISFCDKYEFQTLNIIDNRAHNNMVSEIRALLNIGQAPFDLRKRFPGNIETVTL